MKKFTKTQMIKALEKNRGLVHNTAKYLKCHHQTVYNYIHDDPEIEEAFQNINNQLLDLAEQRLFEAIDRGENWAIPFYLKTKGKSRGYVERQEVTGKDGEGLEIKVTYANRRIDPTDPV